MKAINIMNTRPDKQAATKKNIGLNPWLILIRNVMDTASMYSIKKCLKISAY